MRSAWSTAGQAAGPDTRVCKHTFRTTGITNYFEHDGKLDIAQEMAGQPDESSNRTVLRQTVADRLRPESVIDSARIRSKRISIWRSRPRLTSFFIALRRGRGRDLRGRART